MEKFDIFKDISERTDGDIYIGVVGPVRSGKSTFIRRFMDLMVLPHIENPHDKERAKDELPQGGAGRTIMTTEPKFVPNEAVELNMDETLKFKVRLVDCVGYTVEGATGYADTKGPRMVVTPWFEEAIPFQQAAELGTRKVITEHSTIGLVVTTDGSITEIPRENYVNAEERVINELKELEKPFVILLNSTMPASKDTQKLREKLEEKYQVPVIAVDGARMNQEEIYHILNSILFEFPVREVKVFWPGWINVLDKEHWLKWDFTKSTFENFNEVYKVRDIKPALARLEQFEHVKRVYMDAMDLGTGVASIHMDAKEGLFYNVLSEVASMEINGEHHLMTLMKDLTKAKREYDRISQALSDVRNKGYGMVAPKMEELTLEEPELIRQGNRFGVKLKASAPTFHFIRADIKTEVSPIVGTEKQSEELVNYLLQEFENDTKKIWETNIFGKSLHDLVREGLQNKLFNMPEGAQGKLQETLERIINEGSGGLICIIL